jgi:hypothetical protein
MVSLLHLKTQLETLRDELDGGSEVREMLDKEAPEDVAAVVQVMADLASSLALNVTNFLGEWDFEVDCRRERENVAAGR